MNKILVGTLRKIRTRDSFILLLHRRCNIPYYAEFRCYERKHYYILETPEHLGIDSAILSWWLMLTRNISGMDWIMKKRLLTFTEVTPQGQAMKCPSCQANLCGDNYKHCQPDKFVGKEIWVEVPEPFEHTHYRQSPEYYPIKIGVIGDGGENSN